MSLGLGVRFGGGAAMAALAAVAAGWLGRWTLPLGFALGLLLAPRPAAPAPPYVEGVFRIVTVAAPARFGEGWETDAAGPGGVYRIEGLREEPTLGSAWFLAGEVRPFSERRAESERLRGRSGRVKPVRALLKEEGPAVAVAAKGGRASFHRFVTRALGAREAAFVEALAANLTAGLEDDQRAALRDSGTVHLVSASGYHAGVLLGFAMLVLGRLPVPRAGQIAVGLGLLGLYATAAGLQAPIVRAALMAAVLLAAPFVRRTPDALSALGFSAFIWLLFRPGDLLDIGFGLSYLTLGAMVIGGWARSGPDLLGRTGFWAVAGSSPVTAWLFGRVAVYGLVANVVVELAVPLVLALAVGGWALAAVSDPAGLALGRAAGPLVAGMERFLTWVAAWPGATFAVPTFSGYWLWPVYAFLLAFWRPRRKPARGAE